jgi:hypothetical protein
LSPVPSVYDIDPLQDARWPALLEQHSSAAIFHTPQWLRALNRTYGYSVRALTTSSPGSPLANAVVFCQVHSWLTGRRLVSLPFSDHCRPLVDTPENYWVLLSHLSAACDSGKEKYLEIRSELPPGTRLSESSSFCLHRLDLHPGLPELFAGLQESCIRRKISRAEREGIVYEEGVSEELLRKFFALMLLTRRRHQIPPQPLSWFRNVLDCLQGMAKIRLASHRGTPAAAILTLRYKGVMTYKYGCSDARFHKYGPMQLLMWRAIQEASAAGLLELDMGRTDWDNQGLLSYKDNWGCTRSTLAYSRYPAPQTDRAEQVPMRFLKLVFSRTPDRLLTGVGNLLYRHIG